jgi:signal transduction histidine kinase
MHSQPCFRPDHSPTLQTTQHFSHRQESQGAAIKIENQATIGTCGFATELRQLFTNLIVNAVEAGAGNIRIRISDSRDWKKPARRGLRIVIADNGAGLTPAVAAKAFEPFFTTKEERGTGLGLWVSKGIVQKARRLHRHAK